MKEKYAGVVVPMVTPFTEDGKLDTQSAIRIVNHLCKAGTIPFVLGTTGESASIPDKMKIELVKTTMKHVHKGTTVFAGVSNNCFETSISLAGEFSECGMNAVVAHLPSYFPLSADQMQKYF